jgi:hypothetical protein
MISVNREAAGSLRGLHLLLAGTALLLGAAQAWSSRHEMQPDGLAYLDMGEAYLRGDWKMALNSCFSPLYSWLLAAALRIVRPSAFWEFPTVHLVNFLLYVVALASFVLFWREIRRPNEANLRSLPGWAWWATGYAVFTWASLNLIALNLNNPDLCTSALIYLAAALLVRIWKGRGDWMAFALLGGVLGLAYLAKAHMFGQAGLWLAMLLVAGGRLRKTVPRTALAVLTFVLVAGPFVTALSLNKGRFTFSDTGRLNYIWHVVNWDRSTEHFGRRIHDSPAVYEFQAPIAATYAIFYDPSAWQRDWTVRFDLRRQLRAVAANLQIYYEGFFYMDALLFGGVVLVAAGPGWREGLREAARQWPLWVPSLAALGLFVLVHAETRYVAAFVVMLAGAVLSAARMPEGAEARRWATAVVAVMLALAGLRIAASSARYVARAAADLARGRDTAMPDHWQAAEALKALGIGRGDPVGYIPRPFSVYPPDHEWARLARVRIVTGMPIEEVSAFWKAGAATRDAALKAMAGVGVRAVVADRRGVEAEAEGWQRLGRSSYYIRLMP